MPKTILGCKYNKRYGEEAVCETSLGPQPVLTQEEENTLVEWIIESGRKGFPRRRDVTKSVKDFLDKTPRPNPFTYTLRWMVSAFLRRHPEPTVRTSEGVTSASANVSKDNYYDYDIISRDLKTLELWTNTWQLKLNEKKCTVMHIGQNNPRLPYFLNQVQIQSVEQQKDLGVVVSSNLKWETHISGIVKKASTMVFLIRKAFLNISVDLMLKLYKSFVRPILEYGHSVWSPYFVKDIELLERVQRYVTRTPMETRQMPYVQRLKLFNLTSLKERRQRGDLIEIYKIVNHYYSVNIDILHTSSTTSLRGHSLKLSKERSLKLPRKNFLSNRSVYLWNSLLDDTVTAPSVNSFKNRVDNNLASINNRMVHYM